MNKIFSQLKDEKGQSAVEFALVVILLLLLVFGIVEFGIAWYRTDVLKNAANIGARTCAITRDISKARDAAEDAIPGYDSAKNTITILTCTPAAPETRVTVTVTETFKFDVIPNLTEKITKEPILLKRAATYRVEKDK